MKNKIIDTITFFQENRHFDLRFNILKDVVDEFLSDISITDLVDKPKDPHIYLKEIK